MKKGTKQVSRIGTGGFSLAKEKHTVEDVFPGFPDTPDYNDDGTFEENSLIELDYMKKIFSMADETPPKIEGMLGRTECLYLIFESREQKNELLYEYDLFRIGDKYLEAETFADAFGIDLTSGTFTPKEAKGHSFGKTTTDFSKSLSFGTNGATLDFGVKSNKKEIDESLKETRAREKDLAKWMAWTSDMEYFICLAFKNKEEKEAFQKALNLQAEYDGKYIWCHDFAKAVGATLVPCLFKNKNEYSRCDKKLAEIVYRNE